MRTLRRLLVACFAVGAAAALGCGGPEPPDGDADGDADADLHDADGDADADADDADGDADAEEDVDADADADADAETPETRRRGFVIVHQHQWSDGPRSEAAAYFAFYRDPPEGEVCAWEEVTDACWAYRPPLCDPECDPDLFCDWTLDCSATECVPSFWIDPPLDAGRVTVTGGTHQTFGCSQRPDGEYYCTMGRTELVWASGDVLTVAAAGAEFPAFSLDVGVPEVLAVLLTPDPEGPIATWSLASDEVVEWVSDGSADVVTIRVLAGPAEIWCETEDVGSFTVPAAALSRLPMEADYLELDVTLQSTAVAEEDGDGEVWASAETSVHEILYGPAH